MRAASKGDDSVRSCRSATVRRDTRCRSLCLVASAASGNGRPAVHHTLVRDVVDRPALEPRDTLTTALRNVYDVYGTIRSHRKPEMDMTVQTTTRRAEGRPQPTGTGHHLHRNLPYRVDRGGVRVRSSEVGGRSLIGESCSPESGIGDHDPCARKHLASLVAGA